MRGNTVTIELPLKRGKVSKTIPLYQFDYGQKLIITGAELPEYYEVHFANEMHGDAITSIGDDTGVQIPDSMLTAGDPVYLWLFLHETGTDGETEFQGVIPVIKRARVSDQEPTPEEQSAITEAIAALNAAVGRVEAVEETIEDMSVSATTLEEGESATVTKTVDPVTGEVSLEFGIPVGATGEPGEDGDPGQDGVSPTVAVSTISGGHRVTITDATSTNTFDVMDGEKGDPGDPGEPGDPTELIDDTAGEGDTDLTWSADKLAAEKSSLLTEINSNKNCIEYKFSGSDLLLAFGYSNDNDYVIVMNCGRANGLFDFAKLCTKPKETPLKNLNTADLTTVWSSGTDMHGPFQFLAVNNADGYHSDAVSAGFVGGNHTLDQLGSGFETATSVYVNYYADGSPVSNGYGMATHFGIRWANDVQAYNTVKQGGGGRSCLREYHDIVFDGVCFKERITLKALEEIKMTLWYGLQCVSIGNAYSNIAFVDATNRGIFASSDASIKSGNAVTSGFIAWGNSHRIEMNVDTNIDLGKRTYYSGDKGAFVSNNKGYFYIIGTAVTMDDGAEYYLDGSYRFIPNIVEGIPCTGIALDQNTLTFESAEETKTLTATVTPANTTDTVEWTSSDENIATVNSSGVVTIHGIGSATITATCGSQTATASITQTTLKGEYSTKILENAAFGKDSSIAKVSSNADLNSLGQLYHDAIDDLHVRYGNGNANQIEFIRVPYGATKACIATTDSTAVNVSYGYLVDTTNLITVGTREFPEYVSQTTWVNTETGLSVEYGQAVGFTVTDAQLETLDYVYFK